MLICCEIEDVGVCSHLARMAQSLSAELSLPEPYRVSLDCSDPLHHCLTITRFENEMSYGCSLFLETPIGVFLPDMKDALHRLDDHSSAHGSQVIAPKEAALDTIRDALFQDEVLELTVSAALWNLMRRDAQGEEIEPPQDGIQRFRGFPVVVRHGEFWTGLRYKLKMKESKHDNHRRGSRT